MICRSLVGRPVEVGPAQQVLKQLTACVHERDAQVEGGSAVGNVLLQVGQVDGDIGNFCANRPASVHQVTVTSLSFSLRQRQVLTGMKAGDTLYVASHGNGIWWGSAGSHTSVRSQDLLDFLALLLVPGVAVWLCICDSAPNALYLYQRRPDLRRVVGKQ